MDQHAIAPAGATPAPRLVLAGGIWLLAYFLARYGMHAWSPVGHWDIAVASIPLVTFFWFVYEVQRALHQRNSFRDLFAVPERAVLVLQQNQLAGGRTARRAPRELWRREKPWAAHSNRLTRGLLCVLRVGGRGLDRGGSPVHVSRVTWGVRPRPD